MPVRFCILVGCTGMCTVGWRKTSHNIFWIIIMWFAVPFNLRLTWRKVKIYQLCNCNFNFVNINNGNAEFGDGLQWPSHNYIILMCFLECNAEWLQADSWDASYFQRVIMWVWTANTSGKYLVYKAKCSVTTSGFHSPSLGSLYQSTKEYIRHV